MAEVHYIKNWTGQLSGLIFWVLVSLNYSAGSCRAQILYDAMAGTVPGQQGWGYAVAGTAYETVANGAVTLDTTPSTSTFAGYVQVPAPLNRAHGITLLFSVQIHAESHVKTNRAGFSVIVLAEDKRGIELGFWTDTVFAQNDSPLFTPAESIFLATTNRGDYSLNLNADQYVLRANGEKILSGPVRDYTSFTGTINPYSTPNFVFLGDNTTSASASFSIRKVELIRAPMLTIQSPKLISWQGASNQQYFVQASTNLTDWTTLGAVQSTTADFCYTNLLLLPQQYFRVYPHCAW